MSGKVWIWSGLIVGSFIGGIIPDLFGVGFFSFWSIISSTIGALLGIWIGYKISQNF